MPKKKKTIRGWLKTMAVVAGVEGVVVPVAGDGSLREEGKRKEEHSGITKLRSSGVYIYGGGLHLIHSRNVLKRFFFFMCPLLLPCLHVLAAAKSSLLSWLCLLSDRNYYAYFKGIKTLVKSLRSLSLLNHIISEVPSQWIMIIIYTSLLMSSTSSAGFYMVSSGGLVHLPRCHC